MTAFISIGSTDLFSHRLCSYYDAWTMTEMDPYTCFVLEHETEHILTIEPLTIEHDIDGRSVASFTIWDADAEFTFYERQQVIILGNNGSTAPFGFAGVIVSVAETPIPRSTAKMHYVEAADYTAILEWRIVDYAAEDTLAGDAVTEIMEDYLAEEGITEGVIEDGELLTEISIGNKSVFQAFEKLAEACNFIFYIDYDLKLYFHARTLYAADWSITDTTDILSETLEITRTNEKYRNTQIVVGAYEETDLQTESWVGDGTTKTFPLAYPANRFSTVTVAAANKTIGQKGTDAGSYDCYYAINSETLTFETAPVDGAAIVAEYYGLWQSKSKAEDLTAIANNVTRQGFGSGKVENITIDQSLSSIAAAGEYASAKLSEYGVDGISITYKTRTPGLETGTLQAIKIMDVDEDFLIARVTSETLEGDTTYSVEAYYGPVSDVWEKFFRDEFTAIYQIREGIEEGTGVTKLYTFSHTYEEIDRPNPFTEAPIGAGLLVSSDTWPCFEKSDRAEHIEFWNDGACIFRKAHTSVPDEEENGEYHSYSFISPSEAIGEIDEVIWWSGSSATVAYGSGVEIYRAAFVKTKSLLESFQLNMNYINGSV